jgi:hypothetical protein
LEAVDKILRHSDGSIDVSCQTGDTDGHRPKAVSTQTKNEQKDLLPDLVAELALKEARLVQTKTELQRYIQIAESRDRSIVELQEQMRLINVAKSEECVVDR